MTPLRKKILLGIVLTMFLAIMTAGLASAEESITGTVSEKGEMIMLDAADGSYILEGGDMTPEMVGKKVKVTGTVEVKDDMKVISVMSMEEVTE
jgi:hypothetical protein